jgi:hypothetical protein
VAVGVTAWWREAVGVERRSELSSCEYSQYNAGQAGEGARGAASRTSRTTEKQ